MVIDLTPEQEARVQQIAHLSGRSPSEVMTETALWLLHLDQAQEASLRNSVDQANRGEFIEEEEMDARFARMMQRS